jgi:uncharacterized protein (DUF302 family)
VAVPARTIAIAAVAVLALAACETDDGPAEEPETEQPAEPEPTEPDDDAAEDDAADPDDGADEADAAEPEDVGEAVASGAFGVLAGETDTPVDEVVASLEDIIGEAPAEIAFEVDHAAAAAGVDVELPDTRLLAFGDPEVGTPLMQVEPLMGLDLPAKLLVWDHDGATRVGVNDPAFLAQRHGVDPGEESLVALDEAQRGLLDAVEATGVPARVDPGNVSQGIEVLDSDDDVDATLERAREAIEAGDAELVAEVDHAAAADSVGMELGASTLLVFGNPQVGSPLMEQRRTVGIDLPQKLLVFDDDGQTRVAYNDPTYLRSRHLLSGVDEPLDNLAGALEELAGTAAGS